MTVKNVIDKSKSIVYNLFITIARNLIAIN